MFFGEEDSPFRSLPSEMVVEVLSLVDFDGKKNARLVCRRWRWILDHPDSGLLCFTQEFEVTTEDFVKGLLNGQFHFGKLVKTTEDSLKYLLKSHLHIDKVVLRDIKMTWPMMTYSRNKFPIIRVIQMDSRNSEQTVLTTLQYGCTDTETLILGSECFGLVRPDILSRLMSEMKWNQLTELNLVVTPDNTEPSIENKKSLKNHAGGTVQIFKKATFPNLRSLALTVLPNEEKKISTEIIKLMSNFMNFFERHCRSLKGLGLRISLSPGFPNIPATLFSPEQQENVTANLKLEFLEIHASHFEILNQLVPPCVWKADKLTKLIWRPTGNLSGITAERFVGRTGTARPIESLIQQNQNTLRAVKIDFIGIRHHPHDPLMEVEPIRISCFQPCPALSELIISDYSKVLGVQVQLPQVKKLNLRSFMPTDFFQDISNWVTQSFQNLENVLVSIWIGATVDALQLVWLENLLGLPRLRQIRIRFFCMHSPVNEKTLIRQFCEGQARLMFKTERQESVDGEAFHDEAFVITILPHQNTN